MRIQHNIAALNSYRNLTNNNSAVSKNLEKLSSGYKINRAGDDAAGLAISEKMRAQITGLETAQKNANDGISLVQTAEGALTEVHSMLNRMLELANQSANGTYQNAVDRDNLQKELEALQSEIDRIADATNFNGIYVLNGMEGAESTGTVDSADQVKFTPPTSATLTETTPGAAGTKAKYDLDLTGMSAETAGDVTFTIGDKEYTVTLAAGDDAKAIGDKLVEAFNKDAVTSTSTGAFTATNNNGKVSFEAAKAAVDDSKMADSKGKEITIKAAEATEVTTDAKAAEAPKNANFTIDLSTLTGSVDTNEKLKITIDGVEFVSKGAASKVTDASDIAELFDGQSAKRGDTTYTISVEGTKLTFTAETAGKLGDTEIFDDGEGYTVAKDDSAVGDTNVTGGATGTIENFTNGTDETGDAGDTGTTGAKSGTLTLLVGDSADKYNQIEVTINNMHTTNLGISAADINIKTQTDALDAIQKIKDAINSVSSTRGDLGAIQNRLEHTINNLSVTTENMTAAESRIRDVDMAEEMMAYTKNNILVQASQSMLAQANQIPQGVLQLLQ